MSTRNLTRRRMGEVRATEIDGRPGVTLKVISTGVVDDYGSMWAGGTFDESLGQRLPTLCWAHDWGEPLGPAVGFRTGDDGPEVDFVFSDFEAVPQARRAASQVEDGTIRDCSVGFWNVQRRDPTDAEKERYPGVREIIEKADLDEVSLVLRGAVPGAKVLRTRSGGGIEIDALMEIARRKAAGELTEAEAEAAVSLLGEGSDDGGSSGEESGPSEEEQAAAAAIDAEADAALAMVEGLAG